MKIKLTQIDSFATQPFRGNPAAVCILEPEQNLQLTDDQRLAIAAEMNLSETAFVVPDGPKFQLRWFTPRVEVDLCGHATLAAAHALWSEGRVNWGDPIYFSTRSGELICRSTVEADGESQTIELDFPSLNFETTEPPAGMIESLGVEPIEVVRSRMDYLVQVADESVVRNASPDFAALQSVETRGVMITAATDSATSGYDFVSRFFAPAAGINEDPVTGSAHCLLAPFWQSKLGRSEFMAFQASQRGGEIRIRLEKDRVFLAGNAVTVLNGELYLP